MKNQMVLGLCFLSFASLAEQPPILIQGAMDLETQQLITALEEPQKKTVGSWTFWQGKIQDYPVVISRTEIGIAHAAAATTLAIELFNPEMIINQGTSGGHDPELKRGDIVLGEKSLNIGAYKTIFREKGKGVEPTKWQNFDVVMRMRENEKLIPYQYFLADSELLSFFNKHANLYSKGKVVKGVIGTADEWNREVDRLTWFHENLGTSTEEMETSAAALVAKAYQVPFISVRILSNTDQHQQDFDPKTALDCQAFVLDVVKNMIAEKSLETLNPHITN